MRSSIQHGHSNYSHIPGLESTTFKNRKMGDVKWIRASCLTCWRRSSSSCRCCSIISCCCWILCCICRSHNYNNKLACANNSPGYNFLHLEYFLIHIWKQYTRKQSTCYNLYGTYFLVLLPFLHHLVLVNLSVNEKNSLSISNSFTLNWSTPQHNNLLWLLLPVCQMNY